MVLLFAIIWCPGYKAIQIVKNIHFRKLKNETHIFDKIRKKYSLRVDKSNGPATFLWVGQPVQAPAVLSHAHHAVH